MKPNKLFMVRLRLKWEENKVWWLVIIRERRISVEVEEINLDLLKFFVIVTVSSIKERSKEWVAGGSGKKKSNYKKAYYNSFANKEQQPTSKPNTKSSVRRISKEVVKEKPPVKPKAAPVKRKRFVKPKASPIKSNVGKRKRLDEDVLSEEFEDEGVSFDEEESEEDKGNEQIDETNEADEVVKKITKDEKPLKNKKKRAKHGKDMKKTNKKPLTPTQIKREEYLSEFPSLRFRTVPYSLFSSIRDSQVDMKSFFSDIGFSSLYNVFIDTHPARLARFMVRAFSGLSYEFKLDKSIIRVTPEKFHDVLGVSQGGTSIFDLPEIPLDDPLIKLWFKQFDLKL
nr:ubiquitin-specific protease 13 [Tanacetum cinerariifolium]